jgi:FtsH-binding integral membrane protein
MPGCPYFLANTFAHLLGGVLVTGISSENPIINDIDKKPMSHVTIFMFVFLLLFVLLYTEPGPFKYLLAITFCFSLGQSLSGLVKRLANENLLSNTLIIVGTIFSSMVAIGLLDKGNMLNWGIYLSAGLFGLIIATLGTSFMTQDKKTAETTHVWISRLLVMLFTLYIGFDVQVLKEHAKLCKSKPDYINESLNIYLDIVNLFSSVANSQD